MNTEKQLFDSEEIEDTLQKISVDSTKPQTLVDTQVLERLIEAVTEYMEILVDMEIEKDDTARDRGELKTYTWDETVAYCLNKSLSSNDKP